MECIKVILVVSVCLSAQGAKDDDIGRPYEFGFTIDGQQHRHEKKDANGIIQGEFGFITADGVYHVTVYATDENGSFRILSMKNIKVSGPLDGSGGALPSTKQFSPVQGANLQPNPPPAVPIQTTSTTQVTLVAATQPTPPPPPGGFPTTSNGPYRFTTQSTIKPGCAGCGYVTTSARPPGVPPKFEFQNPAFKEPKQGIQNNKQTNLGTPSNQQLPPPSNIGPTSVPNYNPQSPNYTPKTDQGHNNYQSNLAAPIGSLSPSGVNSVGAGVSTNQGNFGNTPVLSNLQPSPPGETFSSNINSLQPNYQQPNQLGNNPAQSNSFIPTQQDLSANNIGLQNPSALTNTQSQFGNYPPNNFPPQNPVPNQIANYQTPINPTQNRVDDIKVANGVINVPNNPPIKIVDKYPGMSDGLPNGITEGDIVDLLYKFNYTVGFHGHYEKGLRNGTKIGGYFVNGRDGISRVVTYVADEFGYRPKFKLINLGLDSPDTPKEGTEKSFGLKNFEFVWYPLK